MSGRARRGLGALAGAVHRLVHPQHEAEQRQVARIARTLEAVAARQREDAARTRETLERRTDAMQTALSRRDRSVQRGLRQVEASLARQYHITARALKAANWQEELRVRERRLTRRLARIGASEAPVIVGPWSGEVGFELLYWIPFVTWALRRARVSPERVLVISRGGAEDWYCRLGGRYFDALTSVDPNEFRAHTEAEKKQKSVRDFDRRLIRQVLGEAGARRACLLHPGLMYPLFQPFWKQRVSVHRVEAFTRHEMLPPPPPLPVGLDLPPDYVAVRFYFSAAFPDTPGNRAFVDSVVSRLSQSVDVVLLNTGLALDEHRDYTPVNRGRVHTVGPHIAPARNLAVQTAVLGRARAFVGTYGGFSYLAPLLGVRSVAFYSDQHAFFAHHLDFAQRVFRRIGAGSLMPLDVADADLLQMALGPGAGVAAKLD